MRSNDTAKNADQVELRAIQNLHATIDEGLIDEAISGEIEDRMQSDVDPQETEDWSILDSYNDSQQGKIMDELQARSELLGTLYPFNLKHSTLNYNQSRSVDSNIYETLLLTSLTTRRQGRDWLNLVDSFEKLSAWAAQKYFQCSEVWWTGANSADRFKDLIDKIHQKTGELEWDPDPNVIKSGSNVKDAGLDFINYRNLIDSRVGGLFYFGQSACGDDWLGKTRQDLRRGRHRRIFREPYADPVRLFTIPYLITNDHHQMMEAASNISGVVFDRARLTNLLVDMRDDEKVKQEIQNMYCLASSKCN